MAGTLNKLQVVTVSLAKLVLAILLKFNAALNGGRHWPPSRLQLVLEFF